MRQMQNGMAYFSFIKRLEILTFAADAMTFLKILTRTRSCQFNFLSLALQLSGIQWNG